jgi:hypothetical protein
VEEEAGVLPPLAVLEREKEGRSVYEGIITDLRGELERVNASYANSSRRCEVLMMRYNV